MSSKESTPKISIVTPSFNQAPYLEAAIRSVLDQEYPNLEYMVIDGGSTDGSPAIIQKYAGRLAYWVSEPDRGQSHAINKGFARATGEIIGWLNSDDYYLPGTLFAVAETLREETGNFAMVGHCIYVPDDGSDSIVAKGHFASLDRLMQFWKGYQMPQPSIFWRREAAAAAGELDESLHLTMDFDYWVRIARNYRFVNVDQKLSCVNYHREAKTWGDFENYQRELRDRAPLYWPRAPSLKHYRFKSSMFLYTNVLPRWRRLTSLARYYPRRAWSVLRGALGSRPANDRNAL